MHPFTDINSYNSYIAEYFDKINQPKEKKETKELDKDFLWKLFSKNYFLNELILSCAVLKPVCYETNERNRKKLCYGN